MSITPYPIMRRHITRTEKQDLAKFYQDSQLSYAEVAKVKGYNAWNVLKAVHQFGTQPTRAEMGRKKRLKLSDATINEVISEYRDKMPIYKIASKHSVSTTVVQRILRENHVPRYYIGDIRRKYPIDRTIFDHIDTKAKAHFFGLFCADGHNSTERGELSIALKSDDAKFLEQLRAAVGISNPIIMYARAPSKNMKGGQMAKLSFFSKEISQRFCEYGADSNKTVTLDWSDAIPSHLMRYFIRGFLEGDGCISKSLGIKSYETKTGKVFYNRITYCVSFAAPRLFLEGLSRTLSKNLDLPIERFTIRPRKGTYELRIAAVDAIAKVLDYIYTDPYIVMERKYQRYVDFKAQYTKGCFAEHIHTFSEK